MVLLLAKMTDGFRGTSGPTALLIANLTLNWFVPFLVLLPRAAKRSPAIMARIAMLVLFGRWLDLYLMVFPSTGVEGPLWGMHEAAWAILARIPEVAAVILAGCLLCLLFFHSLSRASVVPIGDPLLRESLHLGKHHAHTADVTSSTPRGDSSPASIDAVAPG